MRQITFSHDYVKLPPRWEGTEAMLIAVVPIDMKVLMETNPAFVEYDTKFRGEQGAYKLRFDEGIILVFLHKPSGLPFTTIRSQDPEKLRYYRNSIDQTFMLRREVSS